MVLEKNNFQNEIKSIVFSEGVLSEGGPQKLSSCHLTLYYASLKGSPEINDLINASVAAEFIYLALYNHYWQGKGVGSDVIMGDYFGSVAIIYAAKTNKKTILNVFCKAIQDATNDKDSEHKEAARLAKMYGASAYVGAFLADLDNQLLDEYYKLGEKSGLKLLTSLKGGKETEIDEKEFIELTSAI